MESFSIDRFMQASGTRFRDRPAALRRPCLDAANDPDVQVVDILDASDFLTPEVADTLSHLVRMHSLLLSVPSTSSPEWLTVCELLSRAPSLRMLTLRSHSIDAEAAISLLQACQQVSELIIDTFPLDDVTLARVCDAVVNRPHLQTLSLLPMLAPLQVATVLDALCAASPTIASLDINISTSAPTSFTGLASLRYLTSVRLRSVPPTCLVSLSETFPHLPDLRVCALEMDPNSFCNHASLGLVDDGPGLFGQPHMLDGLKGLTHLDLSNVDYSVIDAMMRKIPSFTRLRSLVMNRTLSPPRSVIDGLHRMPALEGLDLCAAGWTESQVNQALEACPQLQYLWLDVSSLGPDLQIAEPLQHMSSLKSLLVNNIALEHPAAFLASVLTNKPCLEEIFVKRCTPPPTGSTSLSTHTPGTDKGDSAGYVDMPCCPSLRCFLGFELGLGPDAMAAIVTRSPLLERLDLQWEAYDVSERLVLALEGARRLKYLSIGIHGLANEVSSHCHYPARILRSLRSMVDGTAVALPVCTAVVVGDSRSANNRDDRLGKTQLCARIRGMVGHPKELSPVTIGFERHHCMIESETSTGDSRKLQCVLMDFGGQRSLLSAHRLFLGQRLTYIVCIDARLSLADTRVLHWLNSARTNTIAFGRHDDHSRHPPVVIVETHAGSGSRRGYRVAELLQAVDAYRRSCNPEPWIEVVDGYDNYDDPGNDGIVRVRAAVGRAVASAGAFGAGFDRLTAEVVHWFLDGEYPLPPVSTLEAFADRINELNQALPWSDREPPRESWKRRPTVSAEEVRLLLGTLRDLGLVTWLGDTHRQIGANTRAHLFDPGVVNQLLYALLDPTANFASTLTVREVESILKARTGIPWTANPELMSQVLEFMKDARLVTVARHGDEYRVVVPDRIDLLNDEVAPTSASSRWPIVMAQVVDHWPDNLVPHLIAEMYDCLNPRNVPAKDRVSLCVPDDCIDAISPVEVFVRSFPESTGRVPTQISVASSGAGQQNHAACTRVCAWVARLYKQETGSVIGRWRKSVLVIDEQASANQRTRQTESLVTARRNWLDAIRVYRVRRADGVPSALEDFGESLGTVSDAELRRRLTVVDKADLTSGERGWAIVAAMALTSFDSKSSSTASLRRLAAFVSHLDQASRSRATDPKHSSGLAGESNSLKAVLGAGLPTDDDANSAAALFAKGLCWRPDQSDNVISNLSFARLLSGAVTKMFGSRRPR